MIFWNKESSYYEKDVEKAIITRTNTRLSIHGFN